MSAIGQLNWSAIYRRGFDAAALTILSGPVVGGLVFGVRHIEGGRKRLRRALYTASLAASFRWNQQLIDL